jgi:acyl carrier protein
MESIIQDKILQMVNSRIDERINTYSADINLLEVFGLDSIKIMEFLVETEREFNITFDESSLEYDFFTKLENLVNYIKENK